MSFSSAFGVDLGTGSVKVYNPKNDSINKEENMAAVRNGESVIAVGNEAYEISGRNPKNVELIRPMAGGRIQNALIAEAVLHTLLGRASGRGTPGFHPELYFAVPTDITGIERKTYTTIAKKGRYRSAGILLVERPIADALALGIPILNTDGAILINIGYQNTEISVIADRHVIFSQMIPVGGHDFTVSIQDGIRKKNSFAVSESTAQRLKITLCRLNEDRGEGCKVRGIDLDSGLPRDGIVSSANVISCVRRKTDELSLSLKKVMERIPPHIREIASREGIFMTGGSTRIPGSETYFTEALGCPVRVSEYHELSTVCGLKAVMTHRELGHWAYPAGKALY